MHAPGGFKAIIADLRFDRWKHQQNHQQNLAVLAVTFFQRLLLVPLIGGRWYIITQLAIYKWYIRGILPIGWFYITYHLLREPKTTIDFWDGEFTWPEFKGCWWPPTISRSRRTESRYTLTILTFPNHFQGRACWFRKGSFQKYLLGLFTFQIA